MGNTDRTAAVLLIIYTLLCGAEDLKDRSINLKPGLVFTGAGIALCVISQRDPAGIGKALIPGAAVLLMSILTKGAIGKGDALYLLVSALFADAGLIVRMALISMALCSLAALLMIVKGSAECRNMKNEGLPYLTFMMPALIISLVCSVQV